MQNSERQYVSRHRASISLQLSCRNELMNPHEHTLKATFSPTTQPHCWSFTWNLSEHATVWERLTAVIYLSIYLSVYLCIYLCTMSCLSCHKVCRYHVNSFHMFLREPHVRARSKMFMPRFFPYVGDLIMVLSAKCYRCTMKDFFLKSPGILLCSFLQALVHSKMT